MHVASRASGWVCTAGPGSAVGIDNTERALSRCEGVSLIAFWRCVLPSGSSWLRRVAAGLALPSQHAGVHSPAGGFPTCAGTARIDVTSSVVRCVGFIEGTVPRSMTWLVVMQEFQDVGKVGQGWSIICFCVMRWMEIFPSEI